ncbi:MAG: DUF1330 domain-containing protein [Aeromicrobium sp.]|nr:DUF1330 domain-containing protein [Burkholderiales bacterium]
MPKNTSQSYRLAAAALFICLASCAQLTPPSSTPKGYAIAEIAVNDPVAYREYVAAVTPLVAKYGGVYLVRAGKVAAKEGAAAQGRIVVIEFPSFAAAQAFYDSVEYQAIIGLRTKSATPRVLQVEGTARQ